MLMGVLYALAYIVIDMRMCTYIHSVGFCIAYSILSGFPRTSISG